MKHQKALIAFIGSGLISIAGCLLIAMLGQLDIILAPWYCDPKGTWMFPFPFIFNKVISSLEGWEIIYALIGVSLILGVVGSFILGFILGGLKDQ